MSPKLMTRVRPQVEALEDRTVPVTWGTDPFGTMIWGPSLFTSPASNWAYFTNPNGSSIDPGYSSLQGLIDLALPGAGGFSNPFGNDLALLQETGLLDANLLQAIQQSWTGPSNSTASILGLTNSALSDAWNLLQQQLASFNSAAPQVNLLNPQPGTGQGGSFTPSPSLQGLIDLALPGAGGFGNPFGNDLALLQGTGLLDANLLQAIQQSWVGPTNSTASILGLTNNALSDAWNLLEQQLASFNSPAPQVNLLNPQLATSLDSPGSPLEALLLPGSTTPPEAPAVTPAPAGIQDVTGSVNVVISRAGRTRRVTITNTSGAAINGPVWLVLSGLGRKAKLRGAAGRTSRHGQPGSSYVAVSSGLKAGESVKVTLNFGGGAGSVRFDARVLAGAGAL